MPSRFFRSKKAKSFQDRKLGLVSLMNEVRSRSAFGMDPEEKTALVIKVQSELKNIDRITHENRISIKDLPVPSQEAYLMLKSYMKDNIIVSMNQLDKTRQPKSGKIRGIVSSVDNIQQAISEYLRLNAAVNSEDDHFLKIAAMLERTVNRIDGLSRDKDIPIHRLPAPSLLGYQWMRFLLVPGNLNQHISSAIYLYTRFEETMSRSRVTPGKRTEVDFQFRWIKPLYRVRVKGNLIRVSINEAYIFASTDIFNSYVKIALGNNTTTDVKKIKLYAAGGKFSQTATRLSMIGITENMNHIGQYFNLKDVFNRVNKDYFSLKLSQPNLTWNKIPTYRKFGHYEPATDRVMISISLDQKSTPQFVIDYVMYHEILHRVLGIKLVNGRMYSHTHEFKLKEQEFNKYAQAKSWLSEFSKRG